MKWLLILFVLQTSASTTKPQSVTITFTPKEHPDRRTSMILTRDGRGFHCKTDEVPKHRIQTGLTSLESPFKGRNIPDDCKKTVSWGKITRCYQLHETPVLDDVIRWCTNI